jgi:membrane associated rhomboid family serine protease
MDVYSSSDNNEPVTWVRGYPLYAAHMIVVVFVASMLVTAVLMATNATAPLNWLVFRSADVLQGEIWRIATYGLVNAPSLWFVIDMFMIVWFGRELEKTFGRGAFLRFYSCLYLLSPLLLSALGRWLPSQLAGQSGGFGLFIAFATLYPNVSMLLNVLAKWVAIILVGIYSLIHMSRRDTVGLLTLWSTTGFAFAFVRYQQGRLTLPKFRFPAKKPQLRVLPDLPAKSAPKKVVPAKETRAAGTTSMAEIDALLDKIATSGIASLTPKERAKLDAARNDLLKRESGRG